jgi:hypothetical protein
MIAYLAQCAIPRPSRISATRYAKTRLEEVLTLASAGVAVIIASLTAFAHVPLSSNLDVFLFVQFDAVIVLYLTVALTVLQRRRVLGAFLAMLLCNGALAASCAKMTILGAPGSFADVLLVPDLLRVIDPELAWMAILAVATITIAYLANLGAPRALREALLLLPLFGAILFMLGVSMTPALAHAVVGTTPVEGRAFPIFGHFYAAYTSLVRDADWHHTVRASRGADGLELPLTPLRAAKLQSIVPRNLHIVVLESFTDPAWYPRFGLKDVRLPPLFERWRKGPHSTALSPVFGNRSSNAEFEVLCGVPAAVGPSDVIFWRLPERPVPCLPHRLATLGYRSTALHPSPPRTFNLSKAYPALGFEASAFASDLDMSDQDGRFLSAEATFEQHWGRVKPLIDGDQPVLSYVFVNASHFPYDRNERTRPTRLRPEGASPTVTAYMNAIYYVAIAVNRFVNRLSQHDPESLIVVVADHAPALGPNFQGQREGGLLPVDEFDPFSRAATYEVPLIVLDRGELLPLGRLPTYLIPYAVLDRLRRDRTSEAGARDWDGPWRLRALRDRALLVERNGDGELFCSVDSPSERCKSAAEQVRAWQVELLDLVEGSSSPRSNQLQDGGTS